MLPDTLRPALLAGWTGALTLMRPFYDQLFGDADPSSRVSVWVRQTKSTAHLAPSADSFVATCQALDAQSTDVYVGIATRVPGLRGMARGKITECNGVGALWLDVDRLAPDGAHGATNLPSTDEDLAAILAASALPPTMIVDSGYGWHVYWCFPHESISDPQAFNDITRAWQKQFIDYAKTRGWHLDDTGNLDRVLRVPGTHNVKIPSDPKPVINVFSDGPRYTLDALVSSVSTVAAPAPTSNPYEGAESVGAGPALATAPAPAGTPPRTPTGRAPHEVLADLRKALASTKNISTRELAQKILAGESFASPGKRDIELQRAASIIGFLEPDEDPALLAQVLDASLATWEVEDKGKFSQQDRLKWATDKIDRAQRKKRENRAASAGTDRGIERVLIEAARRAPRGADLPPVPQDPSEPYSQDELKAFAAQQGAPDIKSFRKRWIIQRGPSFYVYVNGQYKLPVTKDELRVCVYTDLAPAEGSALSLRTITAKGEPRAKTLDEILAQYCTVARKLTATLARSASYYDEDEEHFYEAVTPLRAITPRYHKEIDTWLTLLGGDHKDKLLDWIASVTKLDAQCCAIFLCGSPGTGKTMLANGLARLWSTGGPTELGRVLGEWSNDLARCPLVFADEEIPKGGARQSKSAALRSLIGSPTRALTRKYQSNADLQGAVRLMLAANNFEMLMFDESLSADDMEAVAARFLFVQTDPTAKHFLETHSTSGWVDDDMIAQHALWLRDNRKVIPGRRFVVEGAQSVLTSMIAVQGTTASMVSEWLAKCLADLNPKSGPISKKLVVFEPGRYLVNANALVDFWDLYVKNQKQPTMPEIGRAIRNLAKRADIRHSGKRYHEINVDTLAVWAESHQIAEAETLKARLYGADHNQTTDMVVGGDAGKPEASGTDAASDH